MQTSAAVVYADAQVFRAYQLISVLQRLLPRRRCQQLAQFPKHKQNCQTSSSILEGISLLHKRSELSRHRWHPQGG